MKKKYKVLIHFAFWLYILNQIFFAILLMPEKSDVAYEEVTIYPLTSFITFYSLYFTYGLFAGSKNKALPVLYLILVISLLIPARIGLEYLFWKYIGFEHISSGKDLMVTKPWWINSIRLVIIYGIYALLIKLAIGWFESQKIKSALVLEKQSGELALLRSQVNPHFLFNTLNNIYSLVYMKSDDAPSAVMKMSAVMRYVLSDAQNDHIPLDKELDYLKSYIELETLRIKYKDFVEINISGNLEGKSIAPMLLIPFIENAFKHGDKSVPTPGIRISLTAGENMILFEVTNSIRKNVTINKDQVGGIGLENICRRLNLQYPGKHQLEINRDEAKYEVKLTLWS